MTIKVFGFKGKRPVISPRLLPVGYAQIAKNVKLGSGAMESFSGTGYSIHALSTVPKTIYKFNNTWMSWSSMRWVERAAISGVDRLLISGESTYPKIITEGGPERRWGVIKPTSILSVTFNGTAADSIVQDTVSYVYTLVTSNGEESDIFTATAAVDVFTGQYISLTGWCVHSGNKGSWLSLYGNDIVGIRVYRLASDSVGNAEYQRVGMRPTETAEAVFEIDINDISSENDPWYDCNASQDGLSQDLGDMLMTEGWDPPPTGMKGACMFQNGMYAGYIGKTVYISMGGYYYAFPASGIKDYTIELPYEIKGMAPFNESLVVATTGYPEIISGTDAPFMTRTPLPYQQPCLSEQGICSLPGGVVYVSPDGLFLVSSSGGQVLTANTIDRDTWNDLDLESAILLYHNQRIFIFFEGSDTGMIYDPTLDYLTDIELSFTLKAAFVDPLDDILYLAGSYNVYAWEGSPEGFLTADWKSGIFETPPMNFPAARVEGVFPPGHNTTFYYYVDGVLKFSSDITSDEPFRLPAGFRGRDHEIRIVFSKSTINAVYLASSFGDLANV